MKFEALRVQAKAIVPVPDHYELRIEDCFKDGIAFFVWADPADQESFILVRTDMRTGALLELSTGNLYGMQEQALSEAERRSAAEGFIQQYYPDLLGEFTWFNAKTVNKNILFEYAQEAGGLPLPRTGFNITVDEAGRVVSFRYQGKVERSPAWPEHTVPVAQARLAMLKNLTCRLVYANLNPQLHELKEGAEKLRLVYEINHAKVIDAVTGEDLYPCDEAAYMEKYIPLPLQEKELLHPPKPEPDIEALVGIDTKTYERIGEEVTEDTLYIRWARRDRLQSDEADKTIEGLFRRRAEGTIMAEVEKPTGRLKSLTGFVRSKALKGELNLDRQACLTRALAFLGQAIPDLERYLQLVERTASEGELEHFIFTVSANGIPVYAGYVMVNVNRTSGQIELYRGPDFDLRRLDGISPEASISVEEALERYQAELEVRPAWERLPGPNAQEPQYKLVYQAVFPEGEICFVDARNGQLMRRSDDVGAGAEIMG